MKHFYLFILMLLSVVGTKLEAQSVIRGPYLQMIGQESVIIRWRTNTYETSKVWYGVSPASLNQSISSTNLTKEHEIQISGLQANSVYYYAIGTTADQLVGADTEYYFKTSPESSIDETINIWVLGDAGKGGANQREVRDAFYAHHGNEPIDLTLLLGDNAYNDGTDVQYQDTWFEDMYEDRLIHTTMFSTYGNHDAFTSNSENETGAYFEIFNHPKNAELGGVPSGREGYYSFDYGDIHFISLNSYDEDLSTDGDQYQWLMEDLNANEKGWLVAFWHYPPHDARNNLSDNQAFSTAMRENYNPLLEEFGVDLVLCGHSHSYQRSFLINDYYGKSNQFDPALHGVDLGDGQIDGDGAYEKGVDNVGTVYMVTGSAGSIASVNDDLEHPAMAYASMVRGSVRLQIQHDELFAEFISGEGIVEDYFTIKKDLPPVGPRRFSITNPLRDGYAAPQPIIVTNEFLDENDTLLQVSYYVNGLLTYVETVYPFNMNYNIPADGDYEIKAIALTVAGLEYTDIVSFKVGSISVCKSVASNTNDAEEKPSGSVSTTSSDLELTMDGDNQQTIGLRYTALRIPNGSAIHHANIQFTTHNINSEDPSNMTIYGEASDHSEDFTSTPFSISSRPKTTASVNWSPPTWQTIGEAGADQRTPDLKNIIQQIVNRPGYQFNAPIGFIITGTGRRTASSYNGNQSAAPVLCLEYTPSYPPDSDGDGTPDSEDVCFNGLEMGALCNDFNPMTYNDTIGPNCNCVGILYDCPTYLADVGTACNDGNPATYDDVIDVNCNCVGTPYDCPVYLADVGTPCDDNNTNTYEDVLNENCDCIGYTLSNPTTIDIPVVLSSDDAEQKPTGSISLSSSDLELTDDNGTQIIGIRFQNVNLPADAFIVESYIQFTTDSESFIDPCELSVYGVLSPNPSTFVNITNNISTRPKTNTSINWSPPQWTSIGSSGSAQRTPELRNLFAELTQQQGYTPGQALAFIIEGTGRRRASSFDGAQAEAPRLVIQYAFPCFDNDVDGICNEDDSCPDTSGQVGDSCNDNNPATYNDLLSSNCTCVGTAYDCPALLANFNTPCDDGNPATYNDVINENCQCTGVDNPFDCTELFLNIGDPCNDNNTNTLNDVVTENCNCVGTPYTTATVTIPVSSSSDDAEEKPTGSVSTTSSDLELTVDGSNAQHIGIRFVNPSIPPGAVVASAYIQFDADESTNVNPCLVQIYGEAATHSMTFEKVDFNISSRSKTNNQVLWQPADNWIEDEVTEKQKTSDLAIIVQEIIDQPGYQLNNPITFLMEGTGVRIAKSFNGESAGAAKLVVQFSYICIDDDNDEICNDFDPCPNSSLNPGAPCDDGNPQTIGDAIDDNCNCGGITPTGAACAKISQSSDDAEERASGTVKIASSDIELVQDNSLQTIGLRFNNLNIPAGVSVSEAWLQFTTDETKNLNPCNLNIYGELNNNPLTFTESDYNISSRLKTETFVTWSPANWTEVGEAGAAQQSVNIAPVIQQLISRPGYSIGDALNIIITGEGFRIAMSYDKDPASAPELCVAYDMDGLIPVDGANPYSDDELPTLSSSNLMVFPNPASNFLSLRFEAAEMNKSVEIQIMDVNGKVLLVQKRSLKEGDTQLDLSNLDLNNGVYFIQLKEEKSLLVGEFVIVK